jgi:Ala-tRNA(Pro) deacylase
MDMITEKLKKYLDENGVRYEALRHGEAYTAQEIASTMHISGKNLVKSVILKSDRGYLMAVLPADRRVDVAALRADLGFRMVTLASEEEIKKIFPDCEAGAMPPFGNLYGLPVYADAALREDKNIVFNAGTHHEAVRMTYTDFFRLVRPIVIEATKKAA